MAGGKASNTDMAEGWWASGRCCFSLWLSGTWRTSSTLFSSATKRSVRGPEGIGWHRFSVWFAVGHERACDQHRPGRAWAGETAAVRALSTCSSRCLGYVPPAPEWFPLPIPTSRATILPRPSPVCLSPKKSSGAKAENIACLTSVLSHAPVIPWVIRLGPCPLKLMGAQLFPVPTPLAASGRLSSPPPEDHSCPQPCESLRLQSLDHLKCPHYKKKKKFKVLSLGDLNSPILHFLNPYRNVQRIKKKNRGINILILKTRITTIHRGIFARGH